MQIIRTFNNQELSEKAVTQPIIRLGNVLYAKEDAQIVLDSINPLWSHTYQWLDVEPFNTSVTISLDGETFYDLATLQPQLKQTQNALTLTLKLPKQSQLKQISLCYDVDGDLLDYVSRFQLPKLLQQAPIEIAISDRLQGRRWVLPDYFDETIVKGGTFCPFTGGSYPGTLGNRCLFFNTQAEHGQIKLQMNPTIEYEDVQQMFQIQSLPCVLVRRLEPEKLRFPSGVLQMVDQSFEVVAIAPDESIAYQIALCLLRYLQEQKKLFLPAVNITVGLENLSPIKTVRSDVLIENSLPKVKFNLTIRNLCLT